MNAVEQAADVAIHQMQLNIADAVKFVEREVPGTSRDLILSTLMDSMIFHKVDKGNIATS